MRIVREERAALESALAPWGYRFERLKQYSERTEITFVRDGGYATEEAEADGE